MLADASARAGVPAGVFNYVTGPGGSIGEALVRHPRRCGRHVHRELRRRHASRAHASRRAVAAALHRRDGRQERGDRHAPRECRSGGDRRARSAFGLSGQKCSACSRVYVEHTVFNDFVAALHAPRSNIGVGDPTRARALDGTGDRRQRRSRATRTRSRRSTRSAPKAASSSGGERLDHGDLAHGHYCAPTVAGRRRRIRCGAASCSCRSCWWRRSTSLDEAIAHANASDTGSPRASTASDAEIERLFEGIEAGVCYANRAQGATTGAWPGYQPFGGWKGSGSTGKAGGSIYYLPQYMREQSQTRVRKI